MDELPRLKVLTAHAAYWELVRDGERLAQVALSDEVEAYMVGMLQAAERRADLNEPLALPFLEALLTERVRLQADQLRDVGDRCLLTAGLFPGVAKRKRVSVHYFNDLGRSAYQGVSERVGLGLEHLYAALARRFEECVEVLNALRGSADPSPHVAALKLPLLNVSSRLQ
jgi:hypothetical protein